MPLPLTPYATAIAACVTWYATCVTPRHLPTAHVTSRPTSRHPSTPTPHLSPLNTPVACKWARGDGDGRGSEGSGVEGGGEGVLEAAAAAASGCHHRPCHCGLMRPPGSLGGDGGGMLMARGDGGGGVQWQGAMGAA
ncbi:hypothetical protein K439DRAFT_1624354 [Ramaria rubella]|nr:hypothetical protein K439DRAFT_1624354 [Ramaria rubella]